MVGSADIQQAVVRRFSPTNDSNWKSVLCNADATYKILTNNL